MKGSYTNLFQSGMKGRKKSSLTDLKKTPCPLRSNRSVVNHIRAISIHLARSHSPNFACMRDRTYLTQSNSDRRYRRSSKTYLASDYHLTIAKRSSATLGRS